jgi:hypothetical protein
MKTRTIAKGLVAVGAVLASLAAVEVLLRWLDSYQLMSIALRSRVTQMPASPAGARTSPDVQYLARIPVAQGVDRAWYARAPARPHRVARDPELDRRAARYPADSITPFFSFNHRYLQQQVCGPSRGGELPALDDFFYFDPTDGSPYPTYRHLSHVNPAGWFVSNNFGWRGHDVALNRSARVIRIAFVGASTTIDAYGVPFSHPELVEYWLNTWAAAEGRPYSFEIINAGRSGIDSRSIAAIVRQELLPVDPDLVVFYEGANQFWPGQMMSVRLGRLFPKPARTFRRRLIAEDYSVIVQRILGVSDRLRGGDGREPFKPPYSVAWPPGVDERDPDAFAPVLPMDLKQVVSDLENMRRALAARGGELAVSSFVWLVHDGMTLDLKRHLTIYRYLNDSYWPISYALKRRMADFQNRVFENYARSEKLPYLQIANRFPQDPDLFDDAIHMNDAGLKLQAWVFVQELIPVILAHSQGGLWPRLAPPERRVHPAFDQPDRRLVTLAELRAACS